MTEETRSFNDILSDLRNGEYRRDEAEPEITAEGSTGESEKESAPEEQPEGESQDEAESQPEDGAESDSQADEADDTGDAEPEDKADEPEPDEPTFDIDGEEATLSQLREWKQDGLRHGDYTRKTQDLAAERKSFREQREAESKLLEEILEDDSLSSFVQAHPKVLVHLLKDPENTRAVLGNAEEVQRLWDDYELLMDRPHLANKVFGQGEPDTEVLEQQRLAENISIIANALDEKVDELASQYKGVDPEDVKEYVLSLGGIPTGDGADPTEVVDGFTKLFNLMFIHDSEKGLTSLDDSLIKNHFELLAKGRAAAAVASETDADDHNRQVDEQLKDSSPVPATKKGSKDAPGPGPESLDDGLTIGQRIARLRGIDD